MSGVSHSCGIDESAFVMTRARTSMHTQNMKITQKHENTQKICRADAHDTHWYSPRFKIFSGIRRSHKGVCKTRNFIHLRGNPEPSYDSISILLLSVPLYNETWSFRKLRSARLDGYRFFLLPYRSIRREENRRGVAREQRGRLSVPDADLWGFQVARNRVSVKKGFGIVFSEKESKWNGPFCFIQAADTQIGMYDSFIEKVSECPMFHFWRFLLMEVSVRWECSGEEWRGGFKVVLVWFFEYWVAIVIDCWAALLEADQNHHFSGWREGRYVDIWNRTNEIFDFGRESYETTSAVLHCVRRSGRRVPR